MGKLSKFLIRYINEIQTEVIMVLSDNRFERFIIVPNSEPALFHVMAKFEENSYKKGQWKASDDNLELIYDNGKLDKLILDNTGQPEYILETVSATSKIIYVANVEKRFTHITHDSFIENFVLGYSKMINLDKLQKNMASKIICINKGETGKGILYKNFEYSQLQYA
jgi:hypothetical protein